MLGRKLDAPGHSLILGDAFAFLAQQEDESVHNLVSDPPYLIGYMGRAWDSSDAGVFFSKLAKEAFRVLKPGGHAALFGHPKKAHRLACTLEDEGFEVREVVHWLYYNGTPASVDMSKVIDAYHGMTDQRPVLGGSALHSRGESLTSHKHPTHASDSKMGRTEDIVVTGPASPDAQIWDGYGTGLSPAIEPVIIVRKPLAHAGPWPHPGRTPAGFRVAMNLLTHSTGAFNIDGCRVPWVGGGSGVWPGPHRYPKAQPGVFVPVGRWPANVVHFRKPSRAEKEAGCESLPVKSGAEVTGRESGSDGIKNFRAGTNRTAKAVRNTHVTVKPIDLMRWLVRLVCAPGTTVIDPFMGSGTTGCAAAFEGVNFIGVEREAESYAIAEARVRHWSKVAEKHRWTDAFGKLPTR